MSLATVPRTQGRFFTIKEVAKMFQVSDDSVSRMIRRGELGCVMITKRLKRIPQEAIDLYVSRSLRQHAATWE